MVQMDLMAMLAMSLHLELMDQKYGINLKREIKR